MGHDLVNSLHGPATDISVLLDSDCSHVLRQITLHIICGLLFFAPSARRTLVCAKFFLVIVGGERAVRYFGSLRRRATDISCY